jgi:hypothetical protein
VGEGCHRLGGDGVDALAHAVRTMADEVARQQGNILRARIMTPWLTGLMFDHETIWAIGVDR